MFNKKSIKKEIGKEKLCFIYFPHPSTSTSKSSNGENDLKWQHATKPGWKVRARSEHWFSSHVSAGAPRTQLWIFFFRFFHHENPLLSCYGCSSSFLSDSGGFLQPGLRLAPHQYVPLSSPSTPAPRLQRKPGEGESEWAAPSELDVASPSRIPFVLLWYL